MSAVDLPYPIPDSGGPIRVAFVGQRTYFEASALEAPAAGVHPCFLDMRDGGDVDALLDGLDRFAPHAVVCFRPESLPRGAFADLRAPVVGIITEPLPVPGEPSYAHRDYNLAELRRADPANVDRVITTDPTSWASAAQLLPLWRAMPLPVADGLYLRPRPPRRPPRMIFVGYSSLNRERALIDQKHRFGLRHYAHGLMGSELREALHASDIGLVVRGDEWMHAFESMLLPYLAAGLLVFSDPVRPRFGIEPDLDFIQVEDRFDLDLRIHQVHQFPDLYDRVRIRGHHTSRQFAASRVWPTVVRDLFEDLRVFGTHRLGADGAEPKRLPVVQSF